MAPKNGVAACGYLTTPIAAAALDELVKYVASDSGDTGGVTICSFDAQADTDNSVDLIIAPTTGSSLTLPKAKAFAKLRSDCKNSGYLTTGGTADVIRVPSVAGDALECSEGGGGGGGVKQGLLWTAGDKLYVVDLHSDSSLPASAVVTAAESMFA